MMKIALLALLGLVLGALGGAALGVGAGVAWVEIFKTSDFEGYSGMLVFFTFMPLGALLGALIGGVLFGVMAARDGRIAIERRALPRGAAASCPSRLGPGETNATLAPRSANQATRASMREVMPASEPSERPSGRSAG